MFLLLTNKIKWSHAKYRLVVVFCSCDEKVNGRLYEKCPRSFGTKIFADVIDYKKDGEVWFTVTKIHAQQHWRLLWQ